MILSSNDFDDETEAMEFIVEKAQNAETLSERRFYEIYKYLLPAMNQTMLKVRRAEDTETIEAEINAFMMSMISAVLSFVYSTFPEDEVDGIVQKYLKTFIEVASDSRQEMRERNN